MNQSEFLAMVDERLSDGRRYPTLEEYGVALQRVAQDEAERSQRDAQFQLALGMQNSGMEWTAAGGNGWLGGLGMSARQDARQAQNAAQQSAMNAEATAMANQEYALNALRQQAAVDALRAREQSNDIFRLLGGYRT